MFEKKLYTSAYREAFIKVTNETDIDPKILDKLYKKTSKEFASSSSNSDELFIESLQNVKFNWKSYKRFFKFFLSMDLEPSQWKFQYSGLVSGISVKYICNSICKQHLIELAKFFSDDAIVFKRKMDASAFLESHITSRAMRRQFLRRARMLNIDEVILDWNEWRREKKPYLLEHTIMMTAYNLLHLHSFGEQLEDITPEKYKLCPRDEAENFFAKMWKERKIVGIPPFFPGDTTGISMKTYQDIQDEGLSSR